ncbi:hypothetical protein HYW60_01065 [Candidatus Kaiserbacteria bacterium]|nr:hypothetical protein [Candidatus Kaiserbacteria bacterium]
MRESGFVIPQVVLLVFVLLVVGGGIALVASSGAEQNGKDATDSLSAGESGDAASALDSGSSKAVAKTTIPSPKPPPPSPLPSRPPIASASESLPPYDRTVCPDSSEGNDIFIRDGVRYRVDDEVRRWAEEFCGPNAHTPLVALSPSSTPPSQLSQPPAPPEPMCESNSSPVFTNHITDMSKVNYIVPPPTMGAGPSLKPHSYIGTDHARVPVYAPIDMTLITGAHTFDGPYGFIFKVNCEVQLRFGHITEPIQEIKDVFPSTPAQDSRDQKIDHEIFFKAGDVIAYTTGTEMAGNWDFGVYNSATSNRYANDPEWNISATYTTAVCPFDYFEASLRQAYVSKFNSAILGGNPPHGESFCKI